MAPRVITPHPSRCVSTSWQSLIFYKVEGHSFLLGPYPDVICSWNKESAETVTGKEMFVVLIQRLFKIFPLHDVTGLVYYGRMFHAPVSEVL